MLCVSRAKGCGGGSDLKRQYVETIMVCIPNKLLDRARQCRKERQVTAQEICLTLFLLMMLLS